MLPRLIDDARRGHGGDADTAATLPRRPSGGRRARSGCGSMHPVVGFPSASHTPCE
eukprot:gene14423-47495_t